MFKDNADYKINDWIRFTPMNDVSHGKIIGVSEVDYLYTVECFSLDSFCEVIHLYKCNIIYKEKYREVVLLNLKANYEL